MLITLHEILEKSNKKRTKILLGNQSSRLKMSYHFEVFQGAFILHLLLWNPFYFWKENLDVFSWSFFPFCRTTKCCVFCGWNLFVDAWQCYTIFTNFFRFISFSLGSMYCLAHFFQLSRNRYDIFLKAPLPHCTFTAKIPEIE